MVLTFEEYKAMGRTRVTEPALHFLNPKAANVAAPGKPKGFRGFRVKPRPDAFLEDTRGPFALQRGDGKKMKTPNGARRSK